VVIGMVPSAMIAINGRLARRVRSRMDAQRAVDSADNAPNHPTDETSNGTCGLAAHGSAMGNAVGNTLRLRG
jgi:hypothetical protein